MDESRKAFENLMSGKGWSAQKTDGGDYVHEEVHLMWMSWRESRAAIEIELPESFAMHSGRTHYLYVSEVENAIRAAGIKVKE